MKMSSTGGGRRSQGSASSLNHSPVFLERKVMTSHSMAYDGMSVHCAILTNIYTHLELILIQTKEYGLSGHHNILG